MTPTPGPQHAGLTVLRLLRLFSYINGLRRVLWGGSKLFDREYYLACNPDVGLSRVPPLAHFLLFGAFEGRKPNPLFDPAFYIRQQGSSFDRVTNPLLHYLERGAAHGLKPHPLFEPDGKGSSLGRYLRALTELPDSILYQWWLKQESRVKPLPLRTTPRFSVLLEVSQPRRGWLEEAVASVRSQTYPDWELHITNRADEPWVKSYLDELASDPRIHLGSGSGAGDYVVTLGQDVRLSPQALQWFATEAGAGLIYGDEDHLDADGHRVQPVFKPDWSPDLLLSCNYVGRVIAVSRAAWEAAGGARGYDLALRVSEAHTVKHVARILSSQRIHAVADHAGARQCVAAALLRRGANATVEDGPRAGTFRVFWHPRESTLASVIICSRSPKLLDQCLAAIARGTGHAAREMIVVQHVGANDDEMQAVIRRHGARRVAYSGPFHFSRMNNLGAEAARGEVLVFLNDDTEPLDRTWLERLVGQMERPGAGVAGAKLLYPSGTLQHGGVAVGVGYGCSHPGRNMAGAPPHWPWLDLSREVTAVTGACLAIRADLFRELSGFPEEFPVNFNDIDLCLRVRAAGRRVTYESGAILRHYECQSRRGVVTAAEYELFARRWGRQFKAGDPFYNPNLTVQNEDFSLASPLRGDDSPVRT